MELISELLARKVVENGLLQWHRVEDECLALEAQQHLPMWLKGMPYKRQVEEIVSNLRNVHGEKALRMEQIIERVGDMEIRLKAQNCAKVGEAGFAAHENSGAKNNKKGKGSRRSWYHSVVNSERLWRTGLCIDRRN